MDKAAKGESFEMIGGNVEGSWLELEPFTKICQKWRLKSWPPGHYSRVEMTIKQGKEDTTLALRSRDMPSAHNSVGKHFLKLTGGDNTLQP